MNTSPQNPRRLTKRRGARGPKRGGGAIQIDLNSPPPAADVASSSRTFRTPPHADVIDISPSSSSSSSRRFRDLIDSGWRPSVTFERVVLRAESRSPIDIDDSDDVQVAAQPEPRFTPQAPIVVLDEEEEIIPQPTGTHRDSINLDLSLDVQWLGSKRRAFTNPNPNSDPAIIPQSSSSQPAKEPTFNCPVCMNPLTEPSSTICGHIFCKECITMAIKAQKKCPTCRRKLNASNFHRVYLPSAE
ncbi:hypothetical protein LUZ60_002096 [Juncus effusus]|nr:hypothetical protein LUZ60_002096 [Juncus effusus]